ncbi:hypothetical protein FIBSPDRAFT_501943, partial [Athelia psychrophila]
MRPKPNSLPPASRNRLLQTRLAMHSTGAGGSAKHLAATRAPVFGARQLLYACISVRRMPPMLLGTKAICARGFVGAPHVAIKQQLQHSECL